MPNRVYWKERFRVIETSFFGIAPGTYRDALDEKLEDLVQGGDYTDHIDFMHKHTLNIGMARYLVRPLKVNKIKKGKTLREVRDVVGESV